MHRAMASSWLCYFTLHRNTYLASRIFFPMDFGYSTGMAFASLCTSAVGDRFWGTCCSGDSWDMVKRAIELVAFLSEFGVIGFFETDHRVTRTRLGSTNRSPVYISRDSLQHAT